MGLRWSGCCTWRLPPGEFFPEEFFGGEFGFPGGFPGAGFEEEVNPEVLREIAAAKKREADSFEKRRKIYNLKYDTAKDDSIEREESDFTYLDYNLDPNTTYMYRVKSYGVTVR